MIVNLNRQRMKINSSHNDNNSNDEYSLIFFGKKIKNMVVRSSVSALTIKNELKKIA